MKRLLASMVVLALAAPAVHAEPQARGEEGWRTAFAGGFMVTLTGVTMMWWGNQRIDTAEHALCTDSYEGSACGHAPPSSATEIADYNAKGERGQTVARAGSIVFLVGAVFTAYAGYRGFVKAPPKAERVSITPTASPTGAGAQLTLRW